MLRFVWWAGMPPSFSPVENLVHMPLSRDPIGHGRFLLMISSCLALIRDWLYFDPEVWYERALISLMDRLDFLNVRTRINAAGRGVSFDIATGVRN